jgi:hypothetical protein
LSMVARQPGAISVCGIEQAILLPDQPKMLFRAATVAPLFAARVAWSA